MADHRSMRIPTWKARILKCITKSRKTLRGCVCFFASSRRQAGFPVTADLTSRILFTKVGNSGIRCFTLLAPSSTTLTCSSLALWETGKRKPVRLKEAGKV